MTNGNGNQDDELELIRQLLIATANRAESTDAKLDRLVESQDRTQRQLDQLAVKQDRTQEQLDQLHVRVEETTANVDKLAADAKEDRVLMMEMLDQLVTVRDENKRVLDYLFGQQRNGNGNEPQV